MSLWDTLHKDWDYLKEHVTHAPSFQLPKVNMKAAIQSKLQPMATKAVNFVQKYPTPQSYVAPKINQAWKNVNQVDQQFKNKVNNFYQNTAFGKFIQPTSQVRTRDFIREMPNAVGTVLYKKPLQIAKNLLLETPSRGYASMLLSARKMAGDNRNTIVPQNSVEKFFWGNKPIHNISGYGKEFLGDVGVNQNTARKYAIPTGLLMAGLDVVPIGGGGKTKIAKGAGKFLSTAEVAGSQRGAIRTALLDLGKFLESKVAKGSVELPQWEKAQKTLALIDDAVKRIDKGKFSLNEHGPAIEFLKGHGIDIADRMNIPRLGVKVPPSAREIKEIANKNLLNTAKDATSLDQFSRRFPNIGQSRLKDIFLQAKSRPSNYAGVVAGLETDDQGKTKFDPLKAGLGMFAMGTLHNVKLADILSKFKGESGMAKNLLGKLPETKLLSAPERIEMTKNQLKNFFKKTGTLPDNFTIPIKGGKKAIKLEGEAKQIENVVKQEIPELTGNVTKKELKNYFKQTGKIPENFSLLQKEGKPIAMRQTPFTPTAPPKVRGDISMPEINFGSWKDKKAFNLSRETLERNIEDIAGKDAKRIKGIISEPITQNETNKAQWLTNQRTEIEGIMKKLGIKKNSAEDKLVQKFGEGQFSLDELKQMTPKWQQVQEASNFFRNKYDDYLNQINTIRQKFGYEPIPKRKDYFRHFQDIGGIIDQFGLIGRKQDLPTSISGISDIFKPGKPFTTAELRRKGIKTEESAIRGIDNYLHSVSNQIFHTDSVQRVRGLEKYIRTKSLANELVDQGYKSEDAALKASETVKQMMQDIERGIDAPDSVALPNFVSNISEYGNMLAGKKARFDRSFESVLGRGFYKMANGLRSRTSANMVGANASSALTNFIPFTQSLATTEKTSVAKGLMESLASPFKSDFAEIGGVKSGLLTRRFPKDNISPTAWEKTKSGANWLFDTIDRFASKSIVAGKYFESLKKGMSPEQAMKFADKYASRVLADRSWGQLPNLMNTRSLGPITQFQTEVNNMFSFLKKDMPKLAGGSKAKLASSLAQFTLYSYLFNNVYEKVSGRRPTIDPIYAVQTLLGANQQGEGKSFGKRLYTAGKDIGENLPFFGGITGGRLPISAGIPDVAGLLQGKTSIGKEVTKPLALIAPPFGGLQVKKSLEGMGAFGKGYVENEGGNVQYPVEKNISNLFRGSVFGKYSFPEARAYFNTETKPLGQKQNDLYKMMPENQRGDYYNQVMASRESNKVKNEIKKGQEDQGFLSKLFGGGKKEYGIQDYANAYGYGKLFDPTSNDPISRKKSLRAKKSSLISLYFNDKVPDEVKKNIYDNLGVRESTVEFAAINSLPTDDKAPLLVDYMRTNYDQSNIKQGILDLIDRGVITKTLTLSMAKQGLISPSMRTILNNSIDNVEVAKGLRKPKKGKKVPKMKKIKLNYGKVTLGGSKNMKSNLTLGKLFKTK